MICTQLCPDHLSVRVGDGFRHSEEMIKISNCAFEYDYYYYYHYYNYGVRNSYGYLLMFSWQVKRCCYLKANGSNNKDDSCSFSHIIRFHSYAVSLSFFSFFNSITTRVKCNGATLLKCYQNKNKISSA